MKNFLRRRLLDPLGPVRTPAYPDGRVGALPGPREGEGLEALGVKRLVDPTGGLEIPVAPDRSAANSPEGSSHVPSLHGHARPQVPPVRGAMVLGPVYVGVYIQGASTLSITCYRAFQ